MAIIGNVINQTLSPLAPFLKVCLLMIWSYSNPAYIISSLILCLSGVADLKFLFTMSDLISSSIICFKRKNKNSGSGILLFIFLYICPWNKFETKKLLNRMLIENITESDWWSMLSMGLISPCLIYWRNNFSKICWMTYAI